MNAILIRKATLDDLQVLLEYEQGVITAERPFDATLGKDPISYYDIKELISSDKAEVVVAVHKLQLVSCGYAMIKKAKPYLDHTEYSYLGFMYTHPDFRGKGINSKIIKVLEAWSLERGLAEIRLTVYPENLAAVKAYEKYGFKKHLLEMRLPR